MKKDIIMKYRVESNKSFSDVRDRNYERQVRRREKLDIWVGNILDGKFYLWRKSNGKVRFGLITILLVVIVLIINFSI
jgi:hypothetical protein